MKIFKSLALVAGISFIAANVSAQAPATAPIPAQNQSAPDPAAMAKKMTASIKDNVTGITPDQESKILAANTELAQGMIDAHKSTNGDRDAMRAKVLPLRDARDAKLKTILTADQYDQYQKTQTQRMPGGSQHEPPQGGGTTPIK